MKKVAIVTFMAVSLGFGAGAIADSSNLGKPAPRCLLQEFGGEVPVDVSDYKGKVVYVDFWASWCGPCVQSFPVLDEWHRSMKGRGFEVVAVNLDEDRKDAAEFLAKHPVGFTVATDAGGECPALFGVEAMPSSYLIDRKGNIRHVHLGFRRDERDVLKAHIDALLAEK